jgi:trans-2,3-dihydro-3-hydroxyanthranilate isomerase
VRIFTPTNEIPFAGHPNVGTAFVLARLGAAFGRETGDVMRFEEVAGLVEVEVLRRGGAVTGARFRAPRAPEIGGQIPSSTIAACASLRADDITAARHAPVFASVGLPFAIAEVVSLDALAKASPNTAAFRETDQRHPNDADRFSLFLYVRLSAERVRARMFAPLSNTPEDPATGSAAAALGGLLASLDRDSETLAFTVEQGVEMGRPSAIQVRVTTQDGVRAVQVAGDCAAMMRGAISLGGAA